AWLAEGPHRVVAQAPVHCATVHFSDLRGDFQCPTLCQRSILRQERLEKTWSDGDRLAGCARGIVLQVSDYLYGDTVTTDCVRRRVKPSGIDGACTKRFAVLWPGDRPVQRGGSSVWLRGLELQLSRSRYDRGRRRNGESTAAIRYKGSASCCQYQQGRACCVNSEFAGGKHSAKKGGIKSIRQS